MPVRSSAVPVAESQLKVNLAASGVGLATMGAALSTRLWRYGTSTAGCTDAPDVLSPVLIVG